MTKNKFRDKVFIKIKHSIEKIKSDKQVEGIINFINLYEKKSGKENAKELFELLEKKTKELHITIQR